MRYRVSAAVEGEILLAHSFAVTGPDTQVVEFVATEGKLTSLRVSRSVEATAFGSQIIPASSAKPVTIAVRRDAQVHEDLLRVLQSLESHLSFSLGGQLHRVRWHESEFEFLAENPDEATNVALNSFKETRAYPTRPVRLVPPDAALLVGATATHSHLTERKAFWREATREFETERYVQAFYNFYFVLEDTFSDGRTGKREVLRAFASSRPFLALSHKQLAITLVDPRHGPALRALLQDEQCSETATGLQELLYSLRGRLHHFHSRSSRLQGTPFTQREFETPAWIAMGLATTTILSEDAGLPHRL